MWEIYHLVQSVERLRSFDQLQDIDELSAFKGSVPISSGVTPLLRTTSKVSRIVLQGNDHGVNGHGNTIMRAQVLHRPEDFNLTQLPGVLKH